MKDASPSAAPVRGARSGKSVPAAPARRWAPKILRVADQYMLSRVSGGVAQGLVWFVGLFLLFAIVTGVKKVAQDDVPLIVAIQGIALQMPRIILFTIPAAILYGTVQTFVDMSSKGEITAFMAGGFSLPRLLRLPLIFAVLCALFAFYLQEVLVPGSELRKADLLSLAVRKMAVRDGFVIIDKRSDGSLERVVQAQSFDPAERLLTEPAILLFRPDRTVEFEIRAKRAVWDQKGQSWTFIDGWSRSQREHVKGDFGPPPVTEFNSFEVNFGPDPAKLGGKARGIAQQLADHNYEMVSVGDLMAHRRSLIEAKSAGKGDPKLLTKEISSATFAIHDKFATPLICIAVVLIGAPLGIRPQRSAAAGLALGLSLVVLVLYYLLWTICSQTGKVGTSIPLFFAYLPLFATTTVGLILVKKKN